MKRRLIQIGKSTLLLSVPRDWVKSNNLAKGDEVDINAVQEKLIISSESKPAREKISVDISEYKDMLPRLVYAIYRAGYDEVELRSNNPEEMNRIKSVIWKETVGFEIMDQGKDFCRIINLTGKLDDLPHILRRLFLVTLTISEEACNSVKQKSGYDNILYLEKENNRISTTLIRAMNKFGSHGYKKTGPLYYIVQELERIGDQYKFLAQHFIEADGKAEVRPAIAELLTDVSVLLRQAYELFYKFEPTRVIEIKALRNKIIERSLNYLGGKANRNETIVLHHAVNITTRTFDTITSMFILEL
ncbi:phosphate uptake regulator PhoU [Candidatus Woesearchaeota archaeon]|nr:phosphate uptake regulator PhoU [Candidatus Woesearchaeota archaeon]